jgi:putative acetyltransferase
VSIVVRRATAADRDAIFAVHAAAFPTPAEARLVVALEEDGDALLSLVAADGDAIVGHIFFSRLAVTAGSRPIAAAALAPVAVVPARRYRGIGSGLIDTGLAMIGEEAIDYVFVLGDPEFYERFGFDAAIGTRFASGHAGPYWLALPLGDAPLPRKGEVSYPRAFAALRQAA